MPFQRAAGILLHPTSLPGHGGIGAIGPAALDFADTLAAAGIRLWQMLPLGPTGYGDSPYQSLSAFAGNPLLVALEPLMQEGLLGPDDLEVLGALPHTHVDFGRVVPAKRELLRRAFDRFRSRSTPPEYAAFEKESAGWLDDFALYMAIKDAHGGAPWYEWEEPLRGRAPEALKQARRDLAHEVDLHRFVQFAFFRQWQSLRTHASGKGVKLIGDIPIFVAHDSADVWANQRLFQLNETGRPLVVAGVPPDYFSATGQLWGNPHYRWDTMADEGYAWWVERFRALLRLVDIVRVDHFRGFAGAWEVCYGAETAERGRWVPAPGNELFDAVRGALGEVPVIAEDLGVITPDVEELRDRLGFPGMQILQFAFGSGPRGPGLPHNVAPNRVVYTGTHDNDTTVGWFSTISLKEREFVCDYLGTQGYDISWDLIRAALASVAVLAIVPLQDVLRLGSAARMNFPGRPAGNWTWRFTEGSITPEHVRNLRRLSDLYARWGLTDAGLSSGSDW